jgi:hypothetical protein
MPGTLVITTLSDGTNSTSATNCIQGSAKAWVNFNGTGTVAIRASYNVSSITDNGTGTYTVNFTNAISDANYCVTTAMSTNVSNNRDVGAVYNQLTTSFQIATWLVGGTQEDYALVCASVFR